MSMGYTAYIDPEPEPETTVECSNCEWRGTYANLSAADAIDEAHLTPGDPSPAGRCPECSALVYVVETPTPVPDTPLHHLIEGLQIIAKYDPDAEFAAEHDTFYCGAEELLERMEEPDRRRLIDLGWFTSDDSLTKFI